MLTFKKGDAVKFIDPDSSIIPVLEADGWSKENATVRDEPTGAVRKRTSKVQDSE
jgi:hypothetical protein